MAGAALAGAAAFSFLARSARWAAVRGAAWLGLGLGARVRARARARARVRARVRARARRHVPGQG